MDPNGATLALTLGIRPLDGHISWYLVYVYCILYICMYVTQLAAGLKPSPILGGLDQRGT